MLQMQGKTVPERHKIFRTAFHDNVVTTALSSEWLSQLKCQETSAEDCENLGQLTNKQK
jgi:hypothetical protein